MNEIIKDLDFAIRMTQQDLRRMKKRRLEYIKADFDVWQAEREYRRIQIDKYHRND